MKAKHFLALLPIFLIGAFSFSLKAQTKLPDEGFTSETHKSNIGNIVFSKSEILFQKENASSFVNEFVWGDPIYGRFYWGEGLNNVFMKEEIDTTDGFNLLVEMKANGNLFYSYSVARENGGNTTFPLCFYPSDEDSYKWPERYIIYYNLDKLVAGDNLFQITLYPYNNATEKPGSALCTGSFTLNLDEKSLLAAKQFIYTGFQTKWSSGDNSWEEWNIYLSGKSGSLRTKWSGNKGEWSYSVGKESGTIKQKWSNDPKEWVVNTSSGSIEIRQKWSGDMKEWTVSSADATLTVKTTWSGSDAWKEWDVKGTEGSMKVKTKWSGDDAWKEWNVGDYMPNMNVHMKMAALFICMYAGVLY